MSPHPSPAPSLGRVVAFFAIAVAVTIALSIPFATGLLPGEAVGLIVPLAQLSPLVAALIVRRRARSTWRQDLAFAIPSGKRLGIAMLAGVAAFALVPLAKMLLGLALGAPLATDSPLLSLVFAVPVILVMQIVFAVGEETGWRGWLHGELSSLGFWRSSAVIGVMWALWHLPIVLALGLQGFEAVTYLVTILAVAPLLGALRETSGTVWAAVFGHGLFNSLRVAIDQNLLGPVDPALAWGIEAAGWVLWILAAWIILRLHRTFPSRSAADSVQV